MFSTNSDFKQLLLLHGRDRRFGKLSEELKNLPEELSAKEKKIQIEKESIKLAMNEWRELETRNNSLESEIIGLNDQISRQKNKQLEVKKNEEYQALENEISLLEKKCSDMEDLQIQTLLKIDDAKEVANVAEVKITERVSQLESQRDTILDRKDEIRKELESLESEILDSRNDVEGGLLTVYDRVKKVVSRAPYLAPLEEQKCSGCNLRVSNDVISSVLVERKLTQCDQCGRIVYVER